MQQNRSALFSLQKKSPEERMRMGMQSVNAADSIRKSRWGFVASAAIQHAFSFMGVDFMVYAIWAPGVITILDSYTDEYAEYTPDGGLSCSPADMEILLMLTAEEIMERIKDDSGESIPEMEFQGLTDEAFRDAGIKRPCEGCRRTTALFIERENED